MKHLGVVWLTLATSCVIRSCSCESLGENSDVATTEENLVSGDAISTHSVTDDVERLTSVKTLSVGDAHQSTESNLNNNGSFGGKDSWEEGEITQTGNFDIVNATVESLASTVSSLDAYYELATNFEPDVDITGEPHVVRVIEEVEISAPEGSAVMPTAMLEGDEEISTHLDGNITAPIGVATTTARNILPSRNGGTAPEFTSAKGVCEKCSSTQSTVDGDASKTFELTTVDMSPSLPPTARSLANASDAGRTLTSLQAQEFPWPVKREAVVEGDIVLGGLMMVHEREDTITCGPVMPQGGIQALEAMLYTLDKVNESRLLPNITVGAHILDDCDKDTYGLEMAVDFIKGR